MSSATGAGEWLLLLLLLLLCYVHMAIQDLVIYSHTLLSLHVAESPTILFTFHSVIAPSSMVHTV
jgi:hypothetical protein